MRVAALLSLMLFLVAPLCAQRIDDARAGFAHARDPVAPDGAFVAAAPNDGVSFTVMALTGVGFAATGIAAGGLAGYSLRQCHPDDWWCGVPESLLGALVVEAVMTPIGVHLVHRKGSLRRELLASAAYTLVLGTVGIVTAPYAYGIPLLLIPPAHIIHTIAMEHRAAHRELERR